MGEWMKKMTNLRLLSRQWIVDEQDHIIMGEGRQEILENIERTGSINQTAKCMKMSYKGVWSKIKATEKHLETRLVRTDRKEGTHLTEEGKALLEKYRKLKQQCIEHDNQIFGSLFHQDLPWDRGGKS
jgi:molybdate transport system regulatory protein